MSVCVCVLCDRLRQTNWLTYFKVYFMEILYSLCMYAINGTAALSLSHPHLFIQSMHDSHGLRPGLCIHPTEIRSQKLYWIKYAETKCHNFKCDYLSSASGPGLHQLLYHIHWEQGMPPSQFAEWSPCATSIHENEERTWDGNIWHNFDGEEPGNPSWAK